MAPPGLSMHAGIILFSTITEADGSTINVVVLVCYNISVGGIERVNYLYLHLDSAAAG